jgi:hypothetical protein
VQFFNFLTLKNNFGDNKISNNWYAKTSFENWRFETQVNLLFANFETLPRS